MRAGSVGLLVGLGILALAGGWYLGTATTPTEQSSVLAGQLMFPDLAPRLKDAARIEIMQQGKQTVIEKRPDGVWGIASMHDYPVQETKLHGVLAGLTELRLTEPRTADPGQFSRLGLNDPKDAGSTGSLLQVVDGAGKPVLSVITGHRKVRSQANVPDEIYVRRPSETQSWLAEGSLQVDADPAAWLDRDIMNVSHDRIATVVVGDQAGAGALVFGQVDGKLALTQPATHPALADYKVEDVGRALEALTLQAVKADGDVTDAEAGHAVFTTSDGLAVTVKVFQADKDVWARFSAAADAAKAKAEADRLNARLAGWTYQIGSWKEKSLVPTMDDLKAEQPAPESVKK